MFFNRNRKDSWSRAGQFSSVNGVSTYSYNMIHLSHTAFNFLLEFVNKLLLPISSATSVLGFFLLLVIITQILSGYFLAWYYIPEPRLLIELREEMFQETRFGQVIYQVHVRGVDIIFFLSYIHIVKKIYLKNFISSEGDGWLMGGYAFFWFHYIVFLGICLSGNHLGDLTLTIAANIYWSIVYNEYEMYWPLFTNKHTNADQLTRLMFFHYLTPTYYLYLIKCHMLFCHEAWDSESNINTYEDKSVSWMSWFYDGLIKELQDSWHALILVSTYFTYHHLGIETHAYFFFERWNINELDEIRFYGVAPHWYFKPWMGLLTIAPTHYEGLFWMASFFALLGFAPLIDKFYMANFRDIARIPTRASKIQSVCYFLFLISLATTAVILPCGRYYYEAEGGYVGNTAVKFAYQYIYFYLGFLMYNLDRVEDLVFYNSKHIRFSIKSDSKFRKW